jgi:hypothetical protein
VFEEKDKGARQGKTIVQRKDGCHITDNVLPGIHIGEVILVFLGGNGEITGIIDIYSCLASAGNPYSCCIPSRTFNPGKLIISPPGVIIAVKIIPVTPGVLAPLIK